MRAENYKRVVQRTSKGTLEEENLLKLTNLRRISSSSLT
jgi:hypothetical protein